MSKRSIALLLTLLLAGGLACQTALAETYSFPYAGIRLRAEDGWTVLLPDALDAQADLLAQLGVSADTLAADYAATNTLFEVYFPEGVQVALSAVQTGDTTQWDAMVHMTEDAKAYFAAAYDQPPYEDAEWSSAHPGYMRYHWAYEADGTPIAFAGLSTVRQGMLITLTASGAKAALEDLHAANDAVLGALTFLGATLENASDTATLSVPEDIADDGVVTPLATVDFWPVTYEDTTTLTFRTFPNAEVLLRTTTDTLRARVDEAGIASFKVSTRRETAYTYSIEATAEGRSRSVMEVTVERQLSAEDQELAYRRTARQIDNYGYSNVAAAPEAFAGNAVTFRGSVGGYADIGGFPCVLIYTVNPGRGVWVNPVWVILTEAHAVADGDIRTVYGDIRGDSFPYADENGEERQAPVVIARSVSE